MDKRINMGQLSRKLRLNRETIRQWIVAKKIPAGTLAGDGNFKSRLWTPEEVEIIVQFVNEHPHRRRGAGKR